MTESIGPVLFDPAVQDFSLFDCGDDALNRWLRERAAKNTVGGGSVTWVVVDAEQRVVGFYAAASGAVMHHEVAGKIRRNQPEPIPIVTLGRLGVDLKLRARGRGAAPARSGSARWCT